MLDWRNEAAKDRSFQVDSEGKPVQPSREGLQKGHFFVKYPKTRCARCREFLWVGTLARHGQATNRLEHVECPR